jgi:hypothetical protein
MSDTKQTGEVERKVLISNEDIENVRNYSLHFGVDMTEELEKSMKAFEAAPTYENMLEFKLQICHWLTTSSHESFKDKLWEHPKSAATDALFDLQFDKDLKEELNDTARQIGEAGVKASKGILPE